MPSKLIKVSESTRGRRGGRKSGGPSSAKKVVTTVVVRQTKKKKKKKNGRGSSGVLGVYRPTLVALQNPFNRGACGCKWPSAISGDTETFQIKGSVAITSDSSGSIQFMVLPDPTLSCLLAGGSMVGWSGAYTASSQMFFGISPDSLQGIAAAYRVVSCGIRFRNLMTPLTTAGRLAIAPMYLPGRVANPFLWENNAEAPNSFVRSTLNAGTTSTVNSILSMSNLIDMPGGKIYSMLEMLGPDEIVAVMKTSGESATAFKPCYTRSAGDSGSFSTTVTTGTAVTSTGTLSSVVDTFWGDFRNQGGLYVSGAGMPASAVVLEMDYVYHIEVVHQPSFNGVVSAAVSTAPQTPVRGSYDLYEDIIAAVPDTWLETAIRAVPSAVRTAVRLGRGMSRMFAGSAGAGYDMLADAYDAG